KNARPGVINSTNAELASIQAVSPVSGTPIVGNWSTAPNLLRQGRLQRGVRPMTRGQDNAQYLFRNVTLAGFARVTSCSQPAQPSGDCRRGGAGRSGSPPAQPGGDCRRGGAGRSGSPPDQPGGDCRRGGAGRSGSPPAQPGGDRK